MDEDLDRGWPVHRTLGSVPPDDIAKISLWRLLFARYECTPDEIREVLAELAADRLDGRRCETTIPGIIERGRGGVYVIPIDVPPQLIENWLAHHIRPYTFNAQRRQLAEWLMEAFRDAEQRQKVTR